MRVSLYFEVCLTCCDSKIVNEWILISDINCDGMNLTAQPACNIHGFREQ